MGRDIPGIRWQCEKMETAMAPEQESGMLERILAVSVAQVERWMDVCYLFREWERKEMIIGEPTPETQREHRKALATLLKSTRLMLAMGSDPEAFDAEIYSKLSCLHEQLEHSWDMFYNPPTPQEAQEAEAMLAKVFPE
jgi:hypothetical protein